MSILLDATQIEEILSSLAKKIISATPSDSDIVVIGIRNRGELLAQRLTGRISEILEREIPRGTLDITLYRDDLNCPKGKTNFEVRTTEIGFDIEDKIVILIDDVLYTGRSARAAMAALLDLGRPKAIRLAVLIDRKIGRELPIQADYVGYKCDVSADRSVQVNLVESDGIDKVVAE